MYTTITKNRIIYAIVEAIRPAMLEVYKRTPDVTKYGFGFNANGQLYCSQDKKFDNVVQGMLSCMSVAEFRKEHGKEIEDMGYALNGSGHVVPLETAPERFAKLMINPLGDTNQLIAVEDRTLKACLEVLDKGSNETIKSMRTFFSSKDGTERLIVAAPWRVALGNLYSMFAEKNLAVNALKCAEPIQVLGAVMMTNIFAVHLGINLPGGWYEEGLKYAYLLAKAYYA